MDKLSPVIPRNICLQLILLFSLSLSACQSVDAQRPFVSFQKTIIDRQFSGGYGLTLADIDGDGLTDIVALAMTPARLHWYKNPTWERYEIATATEANVDVAAYDINRDGYTDLVLASAFNLRDANSGGLVHWLENPGNATVNQQWQMHLIDQLPTSHRLRWGDFNGDGRRQLINLPIIGAGAQAPTYRGGAELTVYNIPSNPRSSPWGSAVLDRSLEMAHGLTIMDWDGDGRDDVLTASFNGVDLFQLASRGRFVDRTTLAAAAAGERPAIGASEVAIGISGRPERRFMATIEPWHGNEVVVYRPTSDGSGSFSREVIFSEISGGHALAVADLDNDGFDEIIVGGRGSPYSLLIFRYNPETREWRRRSLDNDVAVSGLVIADLTGNGFKDIVVTGSTTANVVLYRNAGL
jgi:hypothetical protein